jgi:dUTP pyrophosphatase
MKVKYSTEGGLLQKADGNAGYDLSCLESFEIQPKQRVLVSTGVVIETPEDVVGLIWPRSGLAAKHGIDVLAGVIDSTYRGEIKVCLLNTGTDAVAFTSGDRIAQIIFQEHKSYDMERVLPEDVNGNTFRKDSGFGSSGR